MPKNIQYQGREVLGDDVSFSIVREDWNTYQLHDGTEIRMRLVVKEMTRLRGETDEQDKPVYQIQSTNVVVVKHPEQQE